ncbi:MAG: MBOAT family protein [Rhodospirillales bacterium]|nr:MBOAT family protein [Rhodospirillales bacterium]
MTIGLVKKIFIADQLARMVDPIFARSVTSSIIGFVDAWVAALGFSLQIYFDFSAYSDMAIGLGLILGFALPVNFDAPYRATSIREFWRRWHMTLSRFLRDYLYVPLGGGRSGPFRQVLALSVTMLLGGLWHGPSWTFVAWGGIHGLGLAVNHLWRRLGIGMPPLLGWAVTFLFVVAAFVVFRADTMHAAANILGDLVFMAGAPETVAPPTPKTVALLGGALLTAILFPTSQRITFEYLRPRPAVAFMIAAVFVVVLLKIGAGLNVEFIYFQF